MALCCTVGHFYLFFIRRITFVCSSKWVPPPCHVSEMNCPGSSGEPWAGHAQYTQLPGENRLWTKPTLGAWWNLKEWSIHQVLVKSEGVDPFQGRRSQKGEFTGNRCRTGDLGFCWQWHSTLHLRPCLLPLQKVSWRERGSYHMWENHHGKSVLQTCMKEPEKWAFIFICPFAFLKNAPQTLTELEEMLFPFGLIRNAHWNNESSN